MAYPHKKEREEHYNCFFKSLHVMSDIERVMRCAELKDKDKTMREAIFLASSLTDLKSCGFLDEDIQEMISQVVKLHDDAKNENWNLIKVRLGKIMDEVYRGWSQYIKEKVKL